MSWPHSPSCAGWCAAVLPCAPSREGLSHFRRRPGEKRKDNVVGWQRPLRFARLRAKTAGRLSGPRGRVLPAPARPAPPATRLPAPLAPAAPPLRTPERSDFRTRPRARATFGRTPERRAPTRPRPRRVVRAHAPALDRRSASFGVRRERRQPLDAPAQLMTHRSTGTHGPPGAHGAHGMHGTRGAWVCLSGHYLWRGSLSVVAGTAQQPVRASQAWRSPGIAPGSPALSTWSIVTWDTSAPAETTET